MIVKRLSEFLNSRVSHVTRGKAGVVNGDLFGLELEMEGRGVANIPVQPGWSPHEDGSLRRNHGQAIEWVFYNPCDLEESYNRVDNLFSSLKEVKAKIVTSNRTSTHVHFNMSDKQVYQVVNLFLLYAILEDVLTKYCGEDRCGNLFCLNIRDADEIVRIFTKAIFHNESFEEIGNGLRYAGLNLASLNKFKTVEFRTMRGLDNSEDVKTWLSIIDDLCQFACYGMKAPSDLVEDVSILGPKGFVERVFSKTNSELLLKEWNGADLHLSLYDGIRIIQPLAYRVSEGYKDVKLLGKDFWAQEAKKVKAKKIPVRKGVWLDRPGNAGEAGVINLNNAFVNEFLRDREQINVDVNEPLLINRVNAHPPAPRPHIGGIQGFLREEEERIRALRVEEAERALAVWGEQDPVPDEFDEPEDFDINDGEEELDHDDEV